MRSRLLMVRGLFRRRPSFRLRTLMLAVAILAATLGRWMNFRHRAEFHHQELSKIKISDLELWLACTTASKDDSDRHLRAHAAARPIIEFIQYQNVMEDKYTEAFRHPWRLVARDPPAPDLPPEEYQRAFRAAFLSFPPIGERHGSTSFPHAPAVAVPTVSQ